MKAYTVLLQAPDYTELGFLLVHTRERSIEAAIATARTHKLCAMAENPEEFTPVAVFAGTHENLLWKGAMLS